MEDVVSSVVEEVLRNDGDLKDLTVNRDDIIAYTLNRIPPKYITSERGILHGKLDAKFETQQKTDILFSVYEAIGVIKNGRNTGVARDSRVDGGSDRRLPHFVGEVLEETTLSMVPDVEVSILYKGKLMEMIDSDWKNPYKTNRATRGYYHFWPKFDEGTLKKGDKIEFTLLFKHPKFMEKSAEVEIEALAKPDISFKAPIVLIQAKEGVNLDFLYED